VRLLQQYLRHSSLKTSRYLHLTNRGQDDAARKINSVMSIELNSESTTAASGLSI
jgi:hypothetical protein